VIDILFFYLKECELVKIMIYYYHIVYLVF
jgi:hypothetical protein